MLPNEIIHGLSFEPHNQLWKTVHLLLDASIDSEVAQALSKENKGEDRAWYAGRADALIAFKEVLVNTRNDVSSRNQGKEEESYDS
jgi:hypothetical protein